MDNVLLQKLEQNKLCESFSVVKFQKFLLLLRCQNVVRKCLMHIYESTIQPEVG